MTRLVKQAVHLHTDFVHALVTHYDILQRFPTGNADQFWTLFLYLMSNVGGIRSANCAYDYRSDPFVLEEATLLQFPPEGETNIGQLVWDYGAVEEGT